jgi:hypothetical protein
VSFYRPGSRDVPLACLPPIASLWSDAWTVRRVASRYLACKWTVPNLAWWSVPNLKACIVICMCACVGALLTLVCLCFACWWYMHVACVPCLFA